MMTDVRTHVTQSAAQIRESGAEIVDAATRIRRHLGDDPSLLIVGCGDSLAAAELAIAAGHQATSAGNIAWGGTRPRTGQAVIAMSVSGATSATVAAAETAKAAGAPVVAVTANETSPLAAIADRVIRIPKPPACDGVPAGGFLTMGLAITALIGEASEGTPASLASPLDAMVATSTAEWPQPTASLPAALSICSLPELRAARRFWTLKFIEAAGIAARSVPLEEWGHVDYFIGGQPHLDVVLLGNHGRARATALLSSMERIGHHHRVFEAVGHVRLAPGGASDVLMSLVAGAAGALYADECARAWGRRPFRGGAVDMSAAHIQGAS